MDLLSEIIEYLYTFVRDPQTLEKARTKKGSFTRSRKLPFYLCLIFGLAHFTGSLSFGLDEFFALELNQDTIITNSAYSHARDNYDHYPYETAFKEIRDLIDQNYRENNTLKTIYDCQIIAVDGSLVALPAKQGLLRQYGGLGRDKSSPTARMSMLYDTLNDIIYETTFDPLKIGERKQAMKLIEQLSQYQNLDKMVFIFDRGYFSPELVEFLEAHQAKYIFRMRRNLRSTVDNAPLGDSRVAIGWQKVRRVLKFPIQNPQDESEEIETLLTNWEDPKLEEFKDLYFLRWPIEVEYDTIKNKIEMPNFNATSVNGIVQDFWISMIIANIVGVVVDIVDSIIASRHKKHNKKREKYKYQADISEAVNAIHVDLPRILMIQDEKERKQQITHLISYAAENEEPIRKNRSVPRDIVRSARYHYNRKHH